VKITFRQKLFLPLLLSWICLLAVFTMATLRERDLRLEERKAQLSNAAAMAASIAKEYGELSNRGALGESEAKMQTLARVKALRYGDSGYLMVFDKERVLMHPLRADLAGKPNSTMRDSAGKAMAVEAIAATTAAGTGFTEFMWVKPGQQAQLPKLAYTLHYQPWDWYFTTGLYIDDLAVAFRHQLIEAGVWLVVIGAALTAVVSLIIRSVERSLGGDPEYAVALAHSIAAGDLRADIVTRPADDRSLMAAMKAMRYALVAIVGQVRDGTNLIATASRQIASGNLDLSKRTEDQASSLEKTAASMEELTSAMLENAENARRVRQEAASAFQVAGHGRMVVGKVVDTMASIDDSSKKIVNIISVIDGIAFQTNILALNAAVEAARAGEQGRGFAVVAGEVRSLAQRSAAAAREIKVLIGNSVAWAGEGAKLVLEAGTTMEDIVNSVSRVSGTIDAISSATQEQGARIEHINQAIAQMDQITQQNAELVDEAAAASEAMQQQAALLAKLVGVFKLEGERYRAIARTG
jgi:methyl-accepting chemotaxis protein